MSLRRLIGHSDSGARQPAVVPTRGYRDAILDMNTEQNPEWFVPANPQQAVSPEMQERLEAVMYNYQHPPIILYEGVEYHRRPTPQWSEPVAGLSI